MVLRSGWGGGGGGPQVMQDMLLDVLRALASPNLDIRQKTLDLALDLITHRNIDEARHLHGICRKRVGHAARDGDASLFTPPPSMPVSNPCFALSGASGSEDGVGD